MRLKDICTEFLQVTSGGLLLTSAQSGSAEDAQFGEVCAHSPVVHGS